MITIGLVGGVASGKSVVAHLLVELGAGLLDADRDGHELLEHDEEVREMLRLRWGDGVLAPGGRSIIAKIVFAEDEKGAAERKFLENLLHPRIRERLAERGDELAAAGKAAVVLDAPLLLEAGWQPLCDLVLFVDAPRSLRLERARQTRGWGEEEFARREAAQWPVERKRQAANVVISNAGSEAELRQAVDDFWRRTIAG
ncbi:MAG: dephospho-CoA kinase [Pirellulales bacterium]|nr:dephospho-CoA kinase [Pirellulales bacterium]